MMHSMVRPLKVSMRSHIPFLGKEDVHIWMFFNQNSGVHDHSQRLCSLLSNYLCVHQRDILIHHTPEGKPYLPNDPWLSLSLSHSGNDLVVGISKNHSIGVDIEKLNRKVHAESLARRYFFSEEYIEIKALSAHAQREKFLRFWVLKEASVKVWGKGLARDLKRARCRLLQDGFWMIGEEEDACFGKVFAYENRLIAVASLKKQKKFGVSFFMHHELE